MTILKSAAFLIRCDDPAHKGDPEVTVEVGTRVACEDGMRTNGWRVSPNGLLHRCPPCAKRAARAN
jgi:hypothetical protein